MRTVKNPQENVVVSLCVNPASSVTKLCAKYTTNAVVPKKPLITLYANRFITLFQTLFMLKEIQVEVETVTLQSVLHMTEVELHCAYFLLDVI
jgi:hypothetical protein